MPDLAREDNSSFLDTMASIILVKHKWHTLVKKCGLFWSSYTVSVADIIDLLCIKAPNCVSLIIAAPDTPWLSAVTEGIRDVAFPLIARLSLLVCDQRNVRFGCLRPVRVVNQPTPGAISARAFNPAIFRTDGFGICWHGLAGAKFTKLSTLALQFLDPDAAPSVHRLHMLLANAVTLERLSMHGLHVTGGSEELGKLMANLRAPSLSDLHIPLGRDMGHKVLYTAKHVAVLVVGAGRSPDYRRLATGPAKPLPGLGIVDL
ncbi:hypothetical protein B0H14DRAFT_2567730 [Mycena olivaceomarginata]|nr:hypothetical protein B0H14DRAFT_2567730 [Mycena olivaceomarginata]